MQCYIYYIMLHSCCLHNDTTQLSNFEYLNYHTTTFFDHCSNVLLEQCHVTAWNCKCALKFPSLKVFVFITLSKSFVLRRAISHLLQRIYVFITESNVFLFCSICMERSILNCYVIFIFRSLVIRLKKKNKKYMIFQHTICDVMYAIFLKEHIYMFINFSGETKNIIFFYCNMSTLKFIRRKAIYKKSQKCSILSTSYSILLILLY